MQRCRAESTQTPWMQSAMWALVLVVTSALVASACTSQPPSGVSTNKNIQRSDLAGASSREVPSSSCQEGSGTITTAAGVGDTNTSTGDGGPAAEATFDGPFRIAFDEGGNLNILEDGDHHNHPARIREVDPNGQISTVIGPPTPGGTAAPGEAGSLELGVAWGMAFDEAGNTYVSGGGDLGQILRIDPSGDVAGITGSAEVWGGAGDGGPALKAGFATVRDLALDGDGNLYIADIDDNRIRMIDPNGIITTLAGTGEAGFSGDGGPATKARLAAPQGVGVDAQGNVYIADGDNGRIRMVDRSGVIRTVAGGGTEQEDGVPATEAELRVPADVWVAVDGTIYIAEALGHRVMKVGASGMIVTVAGTGTQGYWSPGDGGPATEAALHTPMSMAVGPDGNLYIADVEDGRIRRVCL